MAQSNQRLVLDLDDIERQLREAQSQPSRQPPAKNNPLAELARIVGQNDPFRSLIAGEKAGRPEPLDRDALFVDPPLHPGQASGLHVSASDRAASYAGMADPTYAAEDEGAYPEPDTELQPHQRPRSRKGLIAVGVVLGTAVLAVAGALALRKPSAVTANGEPPIITADKEPLKVQPENPGGVDIPNQNAQVYERGGQDRQTRVVNREEQPVDVQQAARAAQGPSPQAGVVPSSSTATPGGIPAGGPPQISSNGAVASLGEPKRVRTVSVRPDGTILSPDQPSAAPALPAASPAAPRAAVPAPAPPPTASAMTGTTIPPTTPQGTPAPQRPRTEARDATPAATSTPASAPAPGGPPKVAPNAGQTPQAAPRTAAAPAPAPKAVETTSAAGGWAVQLAVQPSEAEARKQAQALRQKYAGTLGGRAPLVQVAEVNGKTLYRIRVGPMSQDNANDLCTKLKAAKGDCFVAKN